MQPVVYTMWLHERTDNFEEARAGGGELPLSEDGRADSPGHNAKYGSYIIMDMKQNKITDLQLVQVIFHLGFCFCSMVDI